MSNKEYMTAKELSEAVGKSSKTIRRYIESGKLQAELHDGVFGKEYRVSLEVAQQFIADHVSDQPEVHFDQGEDTPTQDSVTMSVTVYEQVQAQLQNAAHRVGKLEGLLEGKEQENERLREEINRQDKLVNDLRHDLNNSLDKVEQLLEHLNEHKKRSLLSRLLGR